MQQEREQEVPNCAAQKKDKGVVCQFVAPKPPPHRTLCNVEDEVWEADTYMVQHKLEASSSSAHAFAGYA